MSAESAAQRYIEAINRHNIEDMLILMTDDHRFIDSLGHTVEGESVLYKAWSQYFQMVPDYKISVHGMVSSGGLVMIHGLAAGTLAKDGILRKDGCWQCPAAWRVIAAENRIKEWQVYADNEPIRVIMRQHH